MPIRLFLTQEGYLEINALEQKNFSIEGDGVMLALPFGTIEKGPHYLIIDPSDRLSTVMDYILSELKKSKYPYELDPNLKKYWDNFSFEKRKIESIRKKRYNLSRKTHFSQDIFVHNRKLLPHQVRGLNHALQVENAANFSIPGSGKTQIALGVFISWKKINLIEKALIIGPTSCFEPWESESKECLKHPIKIIRWSGSILKRRKLGTLVKDADLILITYQTASNDHLLLEQLMRRYKTLLILDESHYVKNPTGVRANAVIRLSYCACKRMVLTGTPAPHSLIDIWTQFSFLWPSRQLLGNYYVFRQKLEKYKNPVTKLRKELGPFFIRTTKKELGLPSVKRNIAPVKKEDIPIEQRKIIELLELKTLVEARKFRLSNTDVNILRKWRTARIIRLLQAVSNPALLLVRLDSYKVENEDIDTSDLVDYVEVFSSGKKISAKIKVVIEMTKLLIEANEKVVIWTWFVENIRLLENLLHKYRPLKIYGEVKPFEEEEDPTLEESRERNIHEFKTRKDRPILLANPAACAESISLHKHCQHAIYLDRNFNCGQFLQSMDRIHRVGMPPGLTAVYHIPVINCAIERAVDKRLKKRQKVLYNLLNDPMPVLGVDDDFWIADSAQESDHAFADVLKEIKNENDKKSVQSYFSD